MNFIIHITLLLCCFGLVNAMSIEKRLHKLNKRGRVFHRKTKQISENELCGTDLGSCNIGLKCCTIEGSDISDVGMCLQNACKSGIDDGKHDGHTGIHDGKHHGHTGIHDGKHHGHTAISADQCSASEIREKTEAFVGQSCVYGDLMSEPGNDNEKWRVCKNTGDGHCFYWTLLRFLKAYNLVSHDNTLSSIAAVRSEVLAEVRKDHKARQDEHFTQVIANMEVGLQDARDGKFTGLEGYGTDVDHSYAARVFNICIVTWNPNPGYWSMVTPEPLIIDLVSCRHVMFAINTNNNHFDTLIPRITRNVDELNEQAPHTESGEKLAERSDHAQIKSDEELAKSLNLDPRILQIERDEEMARQLQGRP